MGNVKQPNNIQKINSDFVIAEDKKRRTEERRKLVNNRKLFAIVIAFVLLLAGTVYIKVVREQALTEKINENKMLQTQLTKLKKEEKNLNQEIVNLNDDEYVAKLARKEYYVSTEGEIIFSTPEVSASASK